MNMILIVGGAFQGKEAFARQLSGLEPQEFETRNADGRTDVPDMAVQKAILLNVHLWIRQVMENGGDPELFIRKVIASRPWIVTMDEVGSGIVPIERADREYREAAGRAGQALAAEAEQVYRVVCGMPVRIK